MQRAALTGDPSMWEITENTILKEVIAVHRTKIANAKKSELESDHLAERLKRAESALTGTEVDVTDEPNIGLN